jgi:hypothetical protein
VSESNVVNKSKSTRDDPKLGIEERRLYRRRYNHCLTAAVLLKSYQIFFLEVFSIPFHSIPFHSKRSEKRRQKTWWRMGWDGLMSVIGYGTHINHATHTVTHHITSSASTTYLYYRLFLQAYLQLERRR